MEHSSLIYHTYTELNPLLQSRQIGALIFDMDGVVTQTAKVHAAAWKKMFDAYLKERGSREEKIYQPMEIATDYPKYIDGIPRYDGVRNFLRSRNIELPEGTPADAPGTETIAGLGNQKNVYFRSVMQQQGVDVYTDTVTFIKEQQKAGRPTAIISASKNCAEILQAAGVADLFGIRVDGVVADKLNLKGKPAPDIFLEAARQMQVKPARAAVFEDARAGVKAGKAGGFALVAGINRTHNAEAAALLQHGADVVLNLFKTDI